jgi:serine/threonine-protein kinase
MDESGGKLVLEDALPILTDIADALASLERNVVHRDLKPENVLLHDGHWSLCDLGIARYAEAATSPDTRKHAMTAAYAAPEQWRDERATSATDVYAFGVVAFEAIEGKLPFPGPDFRDQHLNTAPPKPEACPSALASLITQCLFKAGAARPAASTLVARLNAGMASVSPAAERLRAVDRSIVEAEAARAATVSAERSDADRRIELFMAAKDSMATILDMLEARIGGSAPSAKVSRNSGFQVRLGGGQLGVNRVEMAPADCLAVYDYAPAFDVIAHSTIVVRKPKDRYDYEGRAHSLWFCDAHDAGVYRWYELAFMVTPGLTYGFSVDPFPLAPTDEMAASALSPVHDVRQVAWAPLPFDQGDEEQFLERWLGWLAAAADGSLSHPPRMPENSGGKYRYPVSRRG